VTPIITGGLSSGFAIERISTEAAGALIRDVFARIPLALGLWDNFRILDDWRPMSDRMPSGSLTTDQYLRIRDDILNGVFPHGQRLLETALAAKYEVSRTPVREALVALQQDGLIERVDNGFRVRTGTPEDIMEIYEARIALESVAAAAAARRGTELDQARLSAAHEGAVAAAHGGNERGAHECNSDWHVALWQAAHNSTIAATLNRWSAQLRIYDQGPPAPADDLAITDREHGEIMQAIIAGDAEKARQAMTAHLERSRQLRLRALG
jgi:DNA-binding GntR family transcriptional regulator